MGRGDKGAADEELRAKLEETQRRLESTSRELVAALGKLHGTSPPRSPARSRHRKHGGAEMVGTCPCGHVGATCVEHAAASFWRSFVLAYMIRAGVAVFTRGIGLMRGKSPRDVLKLEKLIGENHTHYREDAVRLGLFLGSFTGGYHIVRCNMCNRLGFSPKKAAAVAGTLGGLSSLFLKRKKRRTFALYLMARLAQGTYASQKNNNRFHFWGSHWSHGDVLLFAMSSAQVMYAYVMRPDTLDTGFWNFIVRAGPIDKETLGLLKDQCNGKNVDLRPALAAQSVAGAMDAFGPVVGEDVRCVPCQLMHRSTGCPGCALHVAMSAKDTFRKCFPFYLSIHLVPFAILNAAKALRDPIGTVFKATAATVRSTSFISAFVALYMGTACASRRLFHRDHRAMYYFAGIVAAQSLFLEKKSRRAELALYLMPRAFDSFASTVIDKKLLPRVPHAELALFCATAGGLMHLYENEPDTLAGFMRTTIRRFVHRPNAPLPHSASEAMIQAVGDEDSDNDNGSPRAPAVAKAK